MSEEPLNGSTRGRSSGRPACALPGSPTSSLGATGARRDHAGRLEVGSHLALDRHPEISVIGDASTIAGAAIPGLATVAIQQAHHVARGIRSGASGAAAPFRYFDKGALAVIGRGRAVGEIRGVRISGPPAFLAYLGVHLFYVGGVPGRRVKVLTAWTAAGLGAAQSRVIEAELPPARIHARQLGPRREETT